MQSRTRIHLIGCGKTFADGTRALSPVDLDIDGGETIVLLGPSGCGKTTTLRMIAGLEYPDPGGRVLFDGDDVTALPIERRRVGMVFQSYALFPSMTVAENVAYGLKIRGDSRPDRERQTLRMLDMMHIGELADRRITQLSGGQKQRVALARAIAPEPRVLLLDEPLTALDARLRVTLRTEINDLLRTLGITAVYVTHDQDEAMALGDRIVAMDKGRIAQIGTPRDIYQRPVSPFVATFIGSANKLAGRLEQGVVTIPGLPENLAVPQAAGVTGGAVDVFLRPEAVRLCAAEDAHGEARIDSLAFLGDRQRLDVTAGWGGMTMDVPAAAVLAVGDRIPVRLDPSALMVFAASSAA